MGAPLKYELECGHCGSAFTLEEGAVTRQVWCPVCGGALTVAVPIPIIPVVPAPTAPADPFPPPVSASRAPEPSPPPPAPPEPEPTPVPAPGFPALSPTPPDLSHLTPELRAAHLRTPWPAVRIGLALGRTAAYVALPLYVLFLCGFLVVLPLVPPGGLGDVQLALMFLGLTQIFPMLIHTTGQVICSFAPASYGGTLAAASAGLLGMAAVALAGLLLVPEFVLFAALGAGVLLLLSFAVWLRFLGQLGQRLGDRTLVVDAWSFGSWLWIGFAAALFLSGGAVMVNTVGGGRTLGWVCRAGTGVIGLLLVLGYPALMHTASLAVARRGPVEHKP